MQSALKRDAKGHHISLLSISCTLCMLSSVRHINLVKCNFVHQGGRTIYVMEGFFLTYIKHLMSRHLTEFNRENSLVRRPELLSLTMGAAVAVLYTE